MLDIDLLRDPSFRAATIGAFTVGVAVIGIMTYVPIAVLRVLGLGPLAGAGILAIWPGLSFVVAPQAANAALAGLAAQSVPAGRTAMGSGADNTARYLGSSLGVALIASVLAVAPANGEPAAEFAATLTHAAIVSGLLAIAGALAVAACRTRSVRP